MHVGTTPSYEMLHNFTPGFMFTTHSKVKLYPETDKGTTVHIIDKTEYAKAAIVNTKYELPTVARATLC